MECEGGEGCVRSCSSPGDSRVQCRITGSSRLTDAFPSQLFVQVSVAVFFFHDFFLLARCFAEHRRGRRCMPSSDNRWVSFQIAPTLFHLPSHQGSEAESESEKWSPSFRWQAVTLR